MSTTRPRPRRTAVVAGVVAMVIVALAAACGSGGGPAGSSGATGSSAMGPTTLKPGTPDPCRLVTTDEATAALGETVNAGTPGTGPVPSCTFGAVNGVHLTDSVQIQIQTVTVFDGTWKGRNDAQVQVNFAIDAVPGIGDQAFFQMSNAPSATPVVLGFKRHGHAVYVTVDNENLSKDQLKAAETQLATAAAARL